MKNKAKMKSLKLKSALASALAAFCVGSALGTVAAALGRESGAEEEPTVSEANERGEAAPPTKETTARPNPGDDWILRTPDGEKKDGDEENGRSALDSVAAVGKIVAVDATGIETEDRRRDRRERTPKRPGDAILFLPPVDPSAAEAFCVEIRETSGARDRDRFWLRNGDEFDGELLRVDRRRVWIRAFDVEFAVPQGRVRAVRFAMDDKKEETGEE